MTTYTVLPDLTALLVGFLDSHADLIPLHGGRVGTKLAAGTSTSIRVANIGGTMPWPWYYRGELQIESWGGTDEQATDLALMVCKVIWTMSATYDNVLTSTVTIAPYAAPDLVSNRFRYITQVQIEATP